MSIMVMQFKRDDAQVRAVTHSVVIVLGVAAQRPAVATLFLATITRFGEIEAVGTGRFM